MPFEQLLKAVAGGCLPHVAMAEPCEVQDYCKVGIAPRGYADGELTLTIGPNAIIRTGCVVYAGSTIGADLQMGHGSTIREGNVIGDGLVLGNNARIEPGNVIGDGVHIHAATGLELARIGDLVFIGPNCVLCGDPHPMACPHYRECGGGITIGALSVVGAGSVILPGVTIGERSVVGAGSVVTRDVPSGTVVAGNPARYVKRTSELSCRAGHYEHAYARPPYE